MYWHKNKNKKQQNLDDYLNLSLQEGKIGNIACKKLSLKEKKDKRKRKRKEALDAPFPLNQS